MQGWSTCKVVITCSESASIHIYYHFLMIAYLPCGNRLSSEPRRRLCTHCMSFTVFLFDPVWMWRSSLFERFVLFSGQGRDLQSFLIIGIHLRYSTKARKSGLVRIYAIQFQQFTYVIFSCLVLCACVGTSWHLQLTDHCSSCDVCTKGVPRHFS